MRLSSRSKAQIAELQVQLIAHRKNYYVSKPLSNDLRYDLVIDTGKRLLRAQVKYLNRKSRRGLQLILNRHYGPYKIHEIDILLVYCPMFNAVLAFPPHIFHGKKTIDVNIKNKLSKMHYSHFIWN